MKSPLIQKKDFNINVKWLPTRTVFSRLPISPITPLWKAVAAVAKIQIIVGSETGTARALAAFIAEQLGDQHEVSVNQAAKVEDLVRDEQEILLFCTSNTGLGELPGNLAPLYSGLRREPPRIAGRRFGFINLADSTYPTFAEGGEMLEKALRDIGAERVGEALVVDGSVDVNPMDPVEPWLAQWRTLL